MNGLDLARGLLSEDGEPPLPFERWRALAPCLAGRENDERAELLRAAKVDPARWDRADGYWNLTLVAEHARGDRTRTEDFGRACADELEARRQAGAEDTLPEGAAPPAPPPATSIPGENAPAVVGSDAALLALSIAPPPAPRPALAVPSFLRAEPAERCPAPRPHALVTAPPPRAFGLETVELSPFAVAAGRTATPFAAASGTPAVVVPSYPSPLPRPSGLTLDLSITPVPSLFPLSHAAPSAQDSTGRDRRTEAGTVALDPSQLDALFGRKPAK